MSSAAEPIGAVDVALAHAARLVDSRADLALVQAQEILEAVPAHPIALLVRGKAQRLLGDFDGALATLEPLARSQPRAAVVHHEYGLILSAVGQGEAAVAALRRALELNPELAGAWRALADHLAASGDAHGADLAYARHIQASTQDSRLLKPAAALCNNDIPLAEALLRAHLKSEPTDVVALRMLAEVAGRLRRYADAQLLLERCLELAPSFSAARHNYAIVLNRQVKSAEALPHVKRLLQEEPRNPSYRSLLAAIRANLGDYPESIRLYEQILREYPHQSRLWMSYGHSLKTAGRREDCIAAYRRATRIEPTLGEAYWSLANLKTFRFTEADIQALRAALAGGALTDDDRLHFDFALGKALEDCAAYEESFTHYARGNAIRRRQHHYDATTHSAFIRRSVEFYTPSFFAQRAGAGCAAADPIFIVGLPRAGSTLLEQILASHPLVEGTMELPTLPALTLELAGERARQDDLRYPQTVAALSAEDLRALGERYLARARVHRKTDAPYFIDKMPNNCLHLGLIHLILPNAKIVDARRHPLGCCFSGFKQQFARGQNFTFGLDDIGRYYYDYVRLLAHFDTVLPGRVHRVFYERIIEDTEAEVRALLAHCGLPFEKQCLHFYKNERAVRTASSEQVRQPIFRSAMEQWRHFEPWLGPLIQALGPVLEHYPQVPAFTD